MSKQTLFLCFQGDGPYWQDLRYIPAYPTGFSYAKWAFRYQGKWVAPQMAAEVAKTKDTVLEEPGILGVRFFDSQKEIVLPLRKITVVWIEAQGGITQFYFRLRELLDFGAFSTLAQACRTFPAAELSPDGHVQDSLAYRSAVDVSSLPWATSEAEDDVWSRLVEMISENDSIPLRKETKSATYIRFSNPKEVGKTIVAPSLLRVTEGQGPIYGASLVEGREYHMRLTHRISSTERTGTAPILPMSFELPGTHIQLSEPSLEILGWYQTTPIVFRAVRATNSHQILSIRTSSGGTNTNAESGAGDDGSAVYLPVPFNIRVDWFYRLRKDWALRAALALVLTFQAGVAYFKDFFEKLLAGKASLADLINYWPIILLLLFLGAVASVLVGFLQTGSDPKK